MNVWEEDEYPWLIEEKKLFVMQLKILKCHSLVYVWGISFLRRL